MANGCGVSCLESRLYGGFAAGGSSFKEERPRKRGAPNPLVPISVGQFLPSYLAPVRAKFMAKACVLQQLARVFEGLVVDQHAARQDAKRTFEHAHIAVDDHVPNFGAIEQSFDRRDQYGIVGTKKFAQHNLLRFRKLKGRPGPSAPDRQAV